MSKALDCINNELLIAKVHINSFSINNYPKLFNQIHNIKINSSFNDYSNIESRLLDISFWKIFLVIFALIKSIKILQTVHKTRLHNSKLEKVIKLLEYNIDKLFEWFSDKFLKANPCKCHLLLRAYENATVKLKFKLLLRVLIKAAW